MTTGASGDADGAVGALEGVGEGVVLAEALGELLGFGVADALGFGDALLEGFGDAELDGLGDDEPDGFGEEEFEEELDEPDESGIEGVLAFFRYFSTSVLSDSTLSSNSFTSDFSSSFSFDKSSFCPAPTLIG